MLARRSPLEAFRLALYIALIAPAAAFAAPAPTVEPPFAVGVLQPIDRPNNGRDFNATHRFELHSRSLHIDQTTTDLLVLSADGLTADSLPIRSGQELRLALRPKVSVHKDGPHADRPMIHAPGMLFRTIARVGSAFSVSYTSPFPVVHVDRPAYDVFPVTTIHPTSASYYYVALGLIDIASVRITLDCTNLLDQLTGTLADNSVQPASVTMTDGSRIHVEELTYNALAASLTIRLRGLSPGGHILRVVGDPSLGSETTTIPPPSSRERGILEATKFFSVFQAALLSPASDSTYGGGRFPVWGSVTHDRQVTQLEVNGKRANITLDAATPAGSCMGPVYTHTFSVILDSSDVLSDVTNAAIDASTLPPGGSMIYVLASDGRFSSSVSLVVDTPAQSSAAADPLAAPSIASLQRESCSETNLEGFVRDGVSLAMTKGAMDRVARHFVGAAVCSRVSEYLNGLVGTSIEVRTNACGDSCKIAPMPHSVSGSTLGTRAVEVDYPYLLPEVRLPARHVQAGHAISMEIARVQPFGGDTFQILGSIGENERLADQLDHSPQSRVWTYGYYAHCDELGARELVIERRNGNTPVGIVRCSLFVDCPDDRVRHLRVLSAVLDQESVDAELEFSSDSVEVVVTLGRMEIHVDPPNECFGSFLGVCWCGYNASDVEVRIDKLVARARLANSELVCGLDASREVALSLDEPSIDVRLVNGDVTGLFCDIVDKFSFNVAQQLFDVFAAIKTASFAPAVRRALTDAFENVAVSAGELSFGGLADRLRLREHPLSGAAPVTLSSEAGWIPSADSAGLDFGVWTSFEPSALDGRMTRATEWVRTAAARPSADKLAGGALGVFVSDDALNQLLSAVAKTGVVQVQLGKDSSLTLGSLGVDPRVLSLLGMAPSEPLLLDLRLRQDGVVIPPTGLIVDDPATRGIEILVRAQLASPLLFPRGNNPDSVLAADPTTFCACGDVSADERCATSPCVLGTKIVKLNLLARCDVVRNQAGDWELVTVVDQIQDVTGTPAFMGYEAADFAGMRSEVVASAGPDSLLESLRLRINQKIPRIELNQDLLTLRGALAPPADLRLSAVSTDSAGLGTGDFVGLIRADLGERQSFACRTINPAVSISSSLLGSVENSVSETSAPSLSRAALVVRPNPMFGSARIQFAAKRTSEFRLDVVAITGQRVASITGRAQPGSNELSWDGRGADGRPVEAGIYYVTLKCGTDVFRSSVVLLR